MNIRMRNAFAFTIIFSAIMLACNLTARQPTQPPPSDSEPTATPPTAEVDTPTDTVPEAAPSAGQVEITELNPCALVTKEYVETVFGYSVDEPTLTQETAFSMCFYIIKPGEGLTITIFEGDHAKNNFLNEIAQLQQGCSLSYKATTREETPTPLPPDVEALRSKSISDLFLEDRELWKSCGGSHSQMAELGSNVYALRQMGLNSAGIGITTENIYAHYSLFLSDMTAEQALEAVTKLVKLSSAK